MTSGTFLVYSQEPTVAFLVISTNTGPGRPSFAIWNALRIVGANSSGDLQIKLCLVIGIVTPLISISWKASLPKALTPTLAYRHPLYQWHVHNHRLHEMHLVHEM